MSNSFEIFVSPDNYLCINTDNLKYYVVKELGDKLSFSKSDGELISGQIIYMDDLEIAVFDDNTEDIKEIFVSDITNVYL